jgi:hypothetical protein
MQSARRISGARRGTRAGRKCGGSAPPAIGRGRAYCRRAVGIDLLRCQLAGWVGKATTRVALANAVAGPGRPPTLA